MTVTVRLPNGWVPRDYQRPSWTAWERGCRRSLLVWHRRAGKDDQALHKAAVAAHERVANYWHCLPMYEQARKAIWEAINPKSGKRRIDEAFPREIRQRTDNSSMTIEFRSGSIWKVVGSDNPDTLVGAPPLGIVFSEWALSNPSAWGYLAPILAENGGWADFITTPRGRNHVKSMLDMARKDVFASNSNPEGWFSEVLTPNETGFPVEMVEKQRREYHAIFGIDVGDALIEQEYWCSFEAAILGAYWGREMVEAENQGRITQVDHDPSLPVHTAWDIGVGDDTAIWFFQEALSQVRVIDYYAASGRGVQHYDEVIRTGGFMGADEAFHPCINAGKPYENMGHDYVPHDAKVREWTNSGPDGVSKTRIQTMLELGRKPKLVAQHRIADGVNAVRRILPYCVFDVERCERGLEALRQYRRAWDDDRKVFGDHEFRDWSTHAAAAFRYLAVGTRGIEAPVIKPEPKIQGIRDMTFDQIMARQRPKSERV